MNYQIAILFPLINLFIAMISSIDKYYQFKNNSQFCNLISNNSIERIIDLEVDFYFKINSMYYPFHKRIDEFGQPKDASQLFPGYKGKLTSSLAADNLLQTIGYSLLAGYSINLMLFYYRKS